VSPERCIPGRCRDNVAQNSRAAAATPPTGAPERAFAKGSGNAAACLRRLQGGAQEATLPSSRAVLSPEGKRKEVRV